MTKSGSETRRAGIEMTPYVNSYNIVLYILMRQYKIRVKQIGFSLLYFLIKKKFLREVPLFAN